MNIAAQARHPNLLQFIGATMEGEPIILTELLSITLRSLMATTALSRQQIKSIACDVARALNYLHLSTPDPIIHRDISSANILLEASGEKNWKAKVSDYGSANFMRYSSTVGPGNPLYSAPEAGDPKKHSPKMDVYSFGVLLVEMCSGNHHLATSSIGYKLTKQLPHAPNVLWVRFFCCFALQVRCLMS